MRSHIYPCKFRLTIGNSIKDILHSGNRHRIPSMKCSVVRSGLKDFIYIYLRAGQDFGDLPAELRDIFGEPEFVMNLDLTPERKLAYEDISQVMQNLSEQGYHLQMPPKNDVTGLLDLPK